jgi:2'-5' RNA ligase
MSMVGLRVPAETARVFSELSVPGVPEDPGFLHITMLYMGDDVPVETLAKAMTVMFGITRQTNPFTVRTSVMTCFPKNDDGVPIICRIESEALHFLQGRIKAAFQMHGVPFSDRHPEYKPHVTLAYADEPIEDQAISTLEWGAHEVFLWGGDQADQRLIVTFPLSIDASQRLALRVAQRFASQAYR